MYVVCAGSLALEIPAPAAASLVVETVGPGEMLGVSWMLPPFRWNLDARAVASGYAVELDAACLHAACDADAALGYELYKRFAHVVRERLESARFRLLDLYGHPSGAAAPTDAV